MHGYHLTIVLAPLAAAVVAGLFGRQIGRAGAHWVTILAVGLSFILSVLVLKDLYLDGGPTAHPLDIDIEHHYDEQEKHHHGTDINQHENDGEKFGFR